ncbi:MliC domain containing protein [Lysobacter dokdonensis DS-58]|uniref:MliC domain containing protein n=1 Tax=Lysobacter dokdonensis DS-58 TaxID=1300345 RepID=A0A0A2WKX7_9GAMM|nr:YbaY family lipoprotein [Lysobacter dokdonensis]KGQ20463.1 MliC domain containing protein [Lysobacter dokdonensis DS-58]
MNVLRCVLAMAALVALSGCPEKTPVADDAPIPTESNFIHGRATYLERIKIPPGADFTVNLVDTQLADTPAAVIATTTLEDVAGPPYEFALQYDPAKVRANGRYALSATLRGVDGGLLFNTPSSIPVVPGDQKVVEFRMTRVSTGDAPQPPAQTTRSTWTCDGMTFDAVFDIAGERVDLALPSGAVSLPLAVSASGARYADHLGNEFWTKGAAGTLTRQGGTKVQCVQQDAPPQAGSPWDAAKKRGVAFRAIGNEPGWLLEVGAGETPALHAEVDYGQRKVDIARAQMLSGLMGYAGAAADGTKVRVVLERKPCNDGMSDATYPVDAILEVADKTYRGCGRFLAE